MQTYKKLVNFIVILASLRSRDADVDDAVKMASKWRGMSINGHSNHFSRRHPRPRRVISSLQLPFQNVRLPFENVLERLRLMFTADR